MGYSFRRGWGGPSYRAFGGGGGISFGPPLTPVIKQLILINTGVFLALALLNIFSPPLLLTARWLFGVVPRDTVFSLHLWQPLTYLFMHEKFLHLFFNMFGLWMFGAQLERDWGSRRFLRFYLLTGVGAGVLNVAVSLLWGGPAATVPTIGASGAIYGLLLAFGLLYPYQPIFIWFLFPVPARIFVLIYGTLTFLSALQGPGSGVSHISHLGGMLIGLVYLRGGWLYYRMRYRYANWRMKQARQKFEVYMQEKDKEEQHHKEWIN